MIVVSPEIARRDEFGWLCNLRHLFGWAVEIGVCSGNFAKSFLKTWQGRMLVGIDNYGPYGSDPYDRETDRLVAVSNLSEYGIRWRLCIESNGDEIADKLSHLGPPDFVYIDGDHRYEAVKKDIAVWWPRLSPNGILAGHDYDYRLPGVIQAVDEFAKEIGSTVYLTHEYEYTSWYIYKTRPESLIEKWRRWEL